MPRAHWLISLAQSVCELYFSERPCLQNKTKQKPKVGEMEEDTCMEESTYRHPKTHASMHTHAHTCARARAHTHAHTHLQFIMNRETMETPGSISRSV